MSCLNCTSCSSEPTSMDKWRYTLITTVLFLIIVNPMTYKLTNKLFSKIFGSLANASSGCPSMLGIGIHAVVFTLLLRLLMDMKI